MNFKAIAILFSLIFIGSGIIITAEDTEAADVTYLDISPSERYVNIGSTINVRATVVPLDGEIEWTIDSGAEYITYQLASDTSTHAIKVTGVSPGVAVIRATSATGQTMTATVTVTSAYLVTSIDFPVDDVILGETVTYTATAYPESASFREIEFDVNDPDGCIEYVTAETATGGTITITGKKIGSFTIQAHAVGTSTGIINLDVVGVEPTGVDLSGPTSMIQGGTIQIIAELIPIDYPMTDIVWNVSPASLVTYTTQSTYSGEILDLTSVGGLGTVTITAQSVNGGESDTITVSIIAPDIPVSSITISGPNEVVVGSKIILRAVTMPTNATDRTVTWSIVSGSAAVEYTVESASNGGLLNLTGKQSGTVTIRATSADGAVSQTYTISVVDAEQGGGTPPPSDNEGKPSFSFATIVGVIGQGFFDGSSSLAGLAIMAALFFVMVAFLANVRAPVTYALVPMMLLAIMFAALGIVDTTVSFLIIIICAVLVALTARNLVGGRS